MRDGFGRRFDAGRRVLQVDAEDIARAAQQGVQLRRRQIGGRAAAQREAGKAPFAQCAGQGAHLHQHLLHVALDHVAAWAGHGEQVAKAAAHLAKRDVDVGEEGGAVLLRPQWREGRRLRQGAVGCLVRIGVGIRLVGRVAHALRQGARLFGWVHGGDSLGCVSGAMRKCAYGTFQTLSWATLWPR